MSLRRSLVATFAGFAVTLSGFTAGAVEISTERILFDIEALVGFDSRDSCDWGASPGIKRAENFLFERYSEIEKLKVFRQTFKIPCITQILKWPTRANLVAVLEGEKKPNEVIVVGGHYDSINTFGGLFGSKAPGANDSGSQTAVVLEIARQLAKAHPSRTIVFVAFAGEEQGLYGSDSFVSQFHSHFPGRKIVAMLNFDIVGGDNTVNTDETLNRFRLYAPDTPPHQGLANRVKHHLAMSGLDFKADIHKASDRPGRGGDQLSFQAVGIPAVRFIETVEETGHQHNSDDLPKYLTPTYMAKMAAMGVFVTLGLAED